MIIESIKELIEGKDLSVQGMKESMDEIMDGKATPAQIGAFLSLLRVKGETVDEIAQAAKVMREKAFSIEVKGPVMDTCSTGGTGINHFNISTTVAFVIAGAGVKVAKHGNRAISGRCGSADVLEELGVKVDIPPEQVKNCIENAGIGFLFAPVFHKAMKNVMGPRREMAIRTVFNILGPLTNPASATHQLLGVYDPDLTGVMAEVLGKLGVKRAMVVHGDGGLDEISLTGPTKVSEVKEGKVDTFEVSPEDFGLSNCRIEDIKGGDKEYNAKTLKGILEGDLKGAYRDAVLLNASASFVILEKVSDYRQGVEIAEDSIDSKKALNKLKELIECSAGLSSRE
ncbi:anthranilate phosphoribosyltransferase [Elusimicrobiota bacterium]